MGLHYSIFFLFFLPFRCEGYSSLLGEVLNLETCSSTTVAPASHESGFGRGSRLHSLSRDG